MRLDPKRLAEYAARYEITINHDGLLVIRFYDKHGGLFDVLEAENFKIADSSQDLAVRLRQ